jgi:hypothetical protein
MPAIDSAKSSTATSSWPGDAGWTSRHEPAPLAARGSHATPESTDEVFAPFLDAGADAIAAAAAHARVDVSPAAARAMLAHLARGCHEIAGQVLACRADAHEGPPPDEHGRSATVRDVFLTRRPTAEQWAQVFAIYPVLAQLLSLWAVQWRAAIAELLERLDADRHRLGACFAGGRPIGTLQDYDGGLSDRHCGGRSVAVLTFAAGVRIVYKPRELAGAAHFMALPAAPVGTRPSDIATTGGSVRWPVCCNCSAVPTARSTTSWLPGSIRSSSTSRRC